MQTYIEMVTDWISRYSLKVVAAILILVIGIWISRRISKVFANLLEKKSVDPTLVSFFSKMIYYAMVILVLIAAVGHLGVNTTSFLTMLGAAGLAVGLALKDSLSNFASGIILILLHPFRIGDYVTAGGVSGSVESITIFNTVLNTPDNKKVVVPNGSITNNAITNANANSTRRIDLAVGISYKDDIRKAKDVLNGLVAEDSRILKDPAPKIAVSELGESSINLVVRPWVNTSDYWDVFFDLTEKIKITLEDEGLSIPYPQQDIHVFGIRESLS
ncbi:MAG TPA: mechanosensitive ion channel [Desulfobacteraceae bacterium]|nr:mechanosensitive ion channel [Desulfobacteraceae bacterium]